MNTRLITQPIGDTTDAGLEAGKMNIFGNEKRTALIFIPSRNTCIPYITLPMGFYSVVTKYDKYAGIWPAGFHFAPPWVMVSHMVVQQYVVYDTPVKECPTKDNVMVEVDVSVVFHIKEFEEDVHNFVYKLGPERLEQMLKAFQEEAVRTMARMKKYSSIYDLMDTEALDLPEQVALKMESDAKSPGAVVGEMESEPVQMPGGIEMKQMAGGAPAIPSALPTGAIDLNQDGRIDAGEQLEHTKKTMNEKLNNYGVEIFSITITQVSLPHEFRNQMEEATTFESKNIRAAAEQKYKLLVISDQEKQQMARQELAEELEQARAENNERVANETKITNVFRAGTEAIMADIHEKENADVLAFTSDSQLTVASLHKEKDIELANIEAGAQAQAVQIRSEMDAFVIRQRAEAKNEAAQANAQALLHHAKAEKVAATALKSRREFEAKMSNLRVLKNMSTNDRCAISGQNKDSVVAQMLAAKNASIALGVDLN